MIKSPLNTKTLFVLVRDYTMDGSNWWSEEIASTENKAEALKAAKKLGEKEVWHLFEKKVVACSDRADADRNTRLYGVTA